MSGVTLTLGSGLCTRTIHNCDALLRQFRKDIGCDYIEYQSTSSPNTLVPEDIAVTLLLNSRAGWRAFRSLQSRGKEIPLEDLPNKALEETTLEEREQVASVIAKLANMPGFAASVASKVLHKKRPNLIPIMDNQAVFEAYMKEDWPSRRAESKSVWSEQLILAAINCIARDITRAENVAAWDTLKSIEEKHTLIQLFDSVWWMYFRIKQPV